MLPTSPAASAESDASERVQRVPVTRVRPCSFQPRKDFAPESLRELADSIKEQGIVQPLIVRPQGGNFELIAGERRWRAAQMLGLTEVPVIVREADDRAVLELALIENLQRENLNPIEEAQGYAQLIGQFQLTQEEAAVKVGRSRAVVANALRLLNLVPELQAHVRDGRLSVGHAKAILGLSSADDQKLAAERVLKKSLNVRQTEELVSFLQNKGGGKNAKKLRVGLPSRMRTSPACAINCRNVLEPKSRCAIKKAKAPSKLNSSTTPIWNASSTWRACLPNPCKIFRRRPFATLMNISDLRAQCAQSLLDNAARASTMSAFVGLDGFVDEILHVVDKRESAEVYQRLPTIAKLAERLAAAAGKSANLELVSQMTKLGGNGPIMANALASFGMKVTYLGILGHPNLHPVFEDFAKRAEVHSIAEPGTTDALEFEDGKIMVGKHASLKQVTWENIKSRFGRDKFAVKFGAVDLVGFVNWTMLPYMSDLWEAILREVCPGMKGPRRILFFDLADPEKRTREDILRALDLIGQFEKYFNVILGLNEKEAHEIGEVFGLCPKTPGPESLADFGLQVAAKLKLSTLVIHPVTCALAVSDGKVDMVDGPFIGKPLITTGAGDHFNSGFCLGKLLGLNNAMSLLTGVTTSGFYVRTGQSPSITQVAQ